MITSTLVSGDNITAGSSTLLIPCIIDVCTGGTVGQWYAFQPGDQVTDQIGGGRGADLVLAALANGVPTVYFTPAAATWGPVPTVTHVGSGPTISVALLAGALGPYDDHKILGTIVQGGANGAALISLSYDGSDSPIETIPVPSQTPGQITGTGPITADTLGKANGLTLVFDAPAAKTLTFPAGSLGAVAAGLQAAVPTVAGGTSYTSTSFLAAGIAALAANPRKLRWTTAGVTPADVPASITVTGIDYTDATQTETITPDTSAGSVTTTKVYKALTSWSYTSAPGTAATLAVGYEDAYATAAELATEATTLAAASPIAISFSDVSTATGDFLAVQTTALGGSATVTFDASPGTFATLLGFLGSATSTGLAATYAPPWTGQVLTFDQATNWTLGDTYTIACQGPSASTSATTAAMAVGRANWRETPFGYFAVTAPPSSAANAAALQAACSSTVAPWRTDNSCPVFVMTGTPLFAQSATKATNDANILAADNALTGAGAFGNNAAALDLVAHCDCYVQGSSNLRPGSFRRSAVIAAIIKRATLTKLGSDIAEGVVQGISLRGPAPPGATVGLYARDEFYASAKLGPAAGGNSGPGFSVLTSTPAGVGSPKFAAGVTRAGSTSRYRFSYVVVVALEMSQTLFARASTWVGQTWETNSATGQITDNKAKHEAAIARADLAPLLTPDGQDPSVSSFAVTIDNSGKFVDTSQVPLKGSFVTLGLVLDVDITVTATGTVMSNAPTAAAA